MWFGKDNANDITVKDIELDITVYVTFRVKNVICNVV